MADIQDDTTDYGTSLSLPVDHEDEDEDEDEVTAPSTADDSNDTLLTLGFNQDGGCLAVGTARGFRVCNASPYQEMFRRTFDNHGHSHHSHSHSHVQGGGGGIGAVEMLFRCNLLALVGGGASPQYPTNKVLIWDDHLGKPIGELSFRQRVLAVKLRRDRICVAIRNIIYVYNFGDLALLDTVNTGGEENGLGLLSISTDDNAGNDDGGAGNADDGMVLACPSVQKGQVRVELYGARKNVLIDAHENPLAALALSVDGSLLATASERGTLIRLFETGKKANDSFMSSSNSQLSAHVPGTPLREFRRGVEHAKIGSLTFSLDKYWLACASDRETVHIFKVYEEYPESNSSGGKGGMPGSPAKSKSKSSFSYASKYAKKILPSMLTKSPKKYLQGEQSFVQVRGGITSPRVCAFVPDQPHTIAVAGLDDYGNGCLMLAGFGEDCRGRLNSATSNDSSTQQKRRAVKGEAKRISFHRFFKKSTDKNNRSKFRKSDNNYIPGDDQVICSDEIENVHGNVNNASTVNSPNGDAGMGTNNASTDMDALSNGVGYVSISECAPDVSQSASFQTADNSSPNATITVDDDDDDDKIDDDDDDNDKQQEGDQSENDNKISDEEDKQPSTKTLEKTEKDC